MGCGSNSTQIGQGPAGSNPSGCTYNTISLSAFDLIDLQASFTQLTSVTGDNFNTLIPSSDKFVFMLNCYVKTHANAAQQTVEVEILINGFLNNGCYRTETVQAGTTTATFKIITIISNPIACFAGNTVEVKAKISGTAGDVVMGARVLNILKVI